MQGGDALGSPAAQRRLSVLLGFIIFFSVLNGIMFSVAIPDIAEDFGLSPTAVSWVLTAYIAVFAFGSAVYGKLSDRYGFRGLITIGIVVLNLGSLVGFFSVGYPMLLGARVLQAAGGAAIPAHAMLTATSLFPARSKGVALGTIAAAVALGSGVGPIAGGLISGGLGWRWLFPVSMATLLAIPGLRALLPGKVLTSSGGFDFTGAALLALASGGVLIFLTFFIPAAGAISLVLCVLFGLHVRRAREPFVAPALLGDIKYRNALIAGMLSVSTIFGMMLVIPVMLRDLAGLGAMGIGLVFFPGSFAAALLGRPGGRLSDKYGGVPVTLVAIVLLGAGHIFNSFTAGHGPAVVAASMVVVFLGFTLIQSSLAGVVSETLGSGPLGSGSVGVGMGLYTLVFFMSGAFGSAISGSFIEAARQSGALNPFAAGEGAGAYSNLFLLYGIICLVAAGIFAGTFGFSGRGGGGGVER